MDHTDNVVANDQSNKYDQNSINRRLNWILNMYFIFETGWKKYDISDITLENKVYLRLNVTFWRVTR